MLWFWICCQYVMFHICNLLHISATRSTLSALAFVVVEASRESLLVFWNILLAFETDRSPWSVSFIFSRGSKSCSASISLNWPFLRFVLNNYWYNRYDLIPTWVIIWLLILFGSNIALETKAVVQPWPLIITECGSSWWNSILFLLLFDLLFLKFFHLRNSRRSIFRIVFWCYVVIIDFMMLCWSIKGSN